MKQRKGKPFDLNTNSVLLLSILLFPSPACTELLVKEASGEGDRALAEMVERREFFLLFLQLFSRLGTTSK